MNAEINAFVAKVKIDSALQDQLKEAKCEHCVVTIAGEAGFRISVDDVKSAQAEVDAANSMDWPLPQF